MDDTKKKELLDSCQEIIKLFPKYGVAYSAYINNKNDENLKNKFYIIQMKINNHQDIFFNLFRNIPTDKKLFYVELCYRKLNSIDQNIALLKVLVPMLKRLKKIPVFYIIHKDGDVPSWEAINKKIESLIRMSHL